MSRLHRPQRARRLLLAAVLCLASAPSWADWARDYDLGMRAVAQGDWAEAERRMRAAIAEEGESSARKRFQGQRFDRYLPHWYAGLAAFRQGDCSRALDYWKDAGSRRVVGGIAELAAEQAELGRECETRLAAASAPPAPAPAPAENERAPASTARTAAATTRPQEPARVAQRTPPAEQPPKPAAAKPAPARTEPPRQAAASTRSAPPAELRQALQDWLAGRYQDVLRLQPGAGLDARARSQLLLLRAAARFVQAELSGSSEGMDQVRSDVRAARQAAAVTPDPALYPPRFRALVSATR